jgi:5'-methylthioadenosine phosphorylase
MPEAKLAREAELPYALLGMVTDFDSWREDAAGVEAQDVIALMQANAERARAVLRRMTELIQPERAPSPIEQALDHAIMTAPDHRDPMLVAKLDAVAGRVLNG